jgi:hypothetical protein
MLKHTNCINTSAKIASVPIFLALEIRQIPVIFTWLDLQNLGLLDMAVSSSNARKLWLIILKSVDCKAIGIWHHSHASIVWMILRSVRVTQILVSLKHRGRVSDLTFEAVGINLKRNSCRVEESSDSILSTWEERKCFELIDISQCYGITDIGVSALGHGCGHLQTINLSDCRGITDIGL